MERKFLMRVFITIIVGVIVLVTGCEFEKPIAINSSDPDRTINVPRFQLQYDQIKARYALHWPGSLVHGDGLGKSADDNETLFLLSYQNIHETMTVDENGYLSFMVDYIEGNEDIHMPMDIWNETEDVRPAQASDSNPVTQIITSNGVRQRLTANGDVVSSKQYDPEQFRIDIAYLDSLNIDMCDTCMTNVRRRIQAMENSGENFTMLGEFQARTENEDVDDVLFSKVTKVIDLRTGLVNRVATYDTQGRFSSVVLTNYAIVEGFPVTANIIAYGFGEVNGNWQAKTVTHTDRMNITVSRGSGS